MASIKVTAKNLEVRGCEKRTGKTGNKYLIVRIEDPNDNTGAKMDIIDRNLEHENDYQKGLRGDFIFDLTIRRFKDISIVSFTPYQEEK